MMSEENTENKRELITCDQEVWVMDRIRTAIRMAKMVDYAKRVSAEDEMKERAIAGVIEGCAVEIVRTLGLDVPFINISKRTID